MLEFEFKNPYLKPIDEIVLSSGKEKIPALSEYWVDKKRCLAKYVPLPSGLKSRQSVEFDEEIWLQNNDHFHEDLQWILGLSFHQFWSHVAFEKEFLNPLLFFLQESTPFYIPIRELAEDNEHVVELYEKVCRSALTIVCRLITKRESDAEFLSKEKHAEIIYKNFIITIPMLFDMLTLYGYSNKSLMEKIVSTLLKIEPKYSNDLKMGIKFIQSTFESMKKQLDIIESENSELFKKYEDLAMYLMNVATTLNLIVALVPNDIKAYCSRDLHLEQSIAVLYDHFVPLLYQYSFAVDAKAWFLTYINYSRNELINCFRTSINVGISSILNANDKNRKKLADGVLSIFTECAGYRTFITDYVKLYPIEIDLDIIAQTGKNIDKIKLEFVGEAYKIEETIDSLPKSNVANGFHVETSQSEEDEFEGACALPLSSSSESKKPTADIVEDILQIETSKILELFPAFGVGYIRRLLAFYDNSSEKVISKILEGTLDSSFKVCDEQEPFIPPETPDKVFLATGLERSNIYDGDKFDVLRNDKFSGHVKKNGKFVTKKEPKTFHELFNDKSHVKSLKERYQGYSLVTEGNEDLEYDDEYDDSYEVFAESEPKMKIKFPGKMRDLLPDTLDLPESEDEEQEPETNNVHKNNQLDFCENPEVIRARREQQFQNKMAKKFPQRQPQQQQAQSRDVVGGQKGQGQSNEILRNRQQKSANKSSRANHNRKSGSTFKQSRGMF